GALHGVGASLADVAVGADTRAELRSHELGAFSGATIGAVAAGVSGRAVRALSHDDGAGPGIAAVAGNAVRRPDAWCADCSRRAFVLNAARRFTVARFVARCAELTYDARPGSCERLAQAMVGKAARVFTTFGGELAGGTDAGRTL